MIADAFGRAVLAQIGDGPNSQLSLRQLCAACGEVSSLGASIVLMGGRNRQAATAAVRWCGCGRGAAVHSRRGAWCRRLFRGPTGVRGGSRGHGRSLGAVRSGCVGARDRAVFALPLQVGAIRTGVLSLCSSRVHPLADGEGSDLSILAELATEAVLAMQSAAGAEELAWTLSDAAEHRAVVHQATGMVAMQLECSVQDALSRLRGRAFLDDTGIGQIAQQVVDRGVRFEP